MDRLLEGVSAKARDAFLARCKEEKVPKGTVLKKEGQSAPGAFSLEKGTLSIRRRSGDEEMEVAVATPKDGILFSLTCLVDGGPSLTTVVVVEECTIRRIDRADCDAFCAEEPEAAAEVLRNLSRLLAGHLRKSDAKIAEMYKTLEEVL
ncbi:Crp/Fnr family transcriptional regulator [Nitratifractor sp.]|uniref:Crp/Fnr family transcriptional regulator n=1 Tax=Nitratifractor sp. TaxID=2268144 RepID=UPI0025DAA6EE|nr:Crp/Fnr family transcriptional regulator [Nitratifractor sp.]